MNENTISDKLNNILSVARLAPSVHNTQPWKVHTKGQDSLVVSIDDNHKLKDGDPTGRQTVISLGIFAEAVNISAASFGFRVVAMEYIHDSVTIKYETSEHTDPQVASLVKLLGARSSDRSIYKPAQISVQDLSEIEGTPHTENILVKVITERSIIEQIASLTSKAIRLALSNPSFRNELGKYLVLPLSRKARGIAVRSLYLPFIVEVAQPLLLRLGVSTGAESKQEFKRWSSATAVVAILADGDMPRHWFDAGRAYLSTSLAIESTGLSQATSAAIVEASNYHDDIEESLQTNKRILALIRVGNGSNKRHYSPRVKPSELTT